MPDRRKCVCCGCCGFKPGKKEITMETIKAPAGYKDIRICLMCWGEIMKAFGRMVRKVYVPDSFYVVAASITMARQEKSK